MRNFSIVSQIVLLVSMTISQHKANAQFTITGRVVTQNGEALPFASVFATDRKGADLDRTYCDSTGSFAFTPSFNHDTIFLRAHYLSDSSVAVPARSGDSIRKYLITVEMSRQLKEIVLSNHSFPLIEKKVDRLIFNIDDRALFANKSVLEMLKYVPGVTVYHNAISINGKGNVGVMINDKLVYLDGKDLMDYLNVYKDDIARIEVISAPPAKYDAEDIGGLLNIVTKSNKLLGLYGDVNMSLQKNSFFSGNDGLNLRWRHKNLNIVTSLGYSGGAYQEHIIDNYSFKYPSGNRWASVQNNKMGFRYYRASTSLEYNLSKNTSLTASYSFNYNKSNDRINQLILYYSGNLDSIGKATGSDNSLNRNHIIDINLHRNLNKSGRTVDFYADYVDKLSNEDYETVTANYLKNDREPTGTSFRLFSSGNTPKNLFSIKSDLAWPELIFKFKAEFGLKYMRFDNRSTIEYGLTKNEIKNPSHDAFKYSENISAAYFSLDRSFGKMTSKIGVRYENTLSKGTSLNSGENSRNVFNNLFPDVFLLYHFSDVFSLDGSYSRRINRPRIWDVNPYRWYSGIYSYTVGNPFLRPSIQDNLEVNATFKNSYFLNLNYAVSHRPIVTLPGHDADTVINAKVNNGTLYRFGGSFSVNLSLMKLIQSSFSVSVNSYDYHSPGYSYQLSRSPVECTLSTEQDIQVGNSFSAGVSVTGNLPGGGFEIMSQSGSFDVDLVIRKMLAKNRLSLGLTAQDIFRSSSPHYDINTTDFSSISSNYYDFQSITFDLRYKFGRQLKSVRNKPGISGTERMRL
jgi:hypothetical protein